MGNNVLEQSEYQKVYIMIDKNNTKCVLNAIDYQQNSLNDYINNNRTGAHQYKPLIGVSFHIESSDKCGLTGYYPDVYRFIRDNGSSTFISRNKKILEGLCGLINRVTAQP